MPDGITLDYLAVQATCTLDNTGSGKAVLSPGAGQFWLPTIAHVGTASTKSPTASCSLHVGATGITDYTTQVDFTFSGVSDSSTIVSGMIVSSGESVTAFFLNGKPGDTGYIRMIGVSSSAAPTIGIEPGFPGAKFTGNESTVTIAGQPVNVNISNVPDVLAFFQGVANQQLVANQVPLGINGINIAAGASSVLLPATVGRTYYLHGLLLDMNSNNTGGGLLLEDTSGTVFVNNEIILIGAPTAFQVPPRPYIDLKGAPVASGLGVQLTAPASNTHTIAAYGTLLYSF